MRSIEPADKGALRSAFDRLSEQSRYQRFMTSISELSDSQVAYLTEVDHHDHEALIAFDGDGEAVGVARFVRIDGGTTAEAAVTVVERARADGIEKFTALLLAGNDQMHDVLASLGPAKVLSRDAGTVEVEVEIPEAGIGDHMAGVLRVLAGGTVELATPPWGPRPAPEEQDGE